MKTMAKTFKTNPLKKVTSGSEIQKENVEVKQEPDQSQPQHIQPEPKRGKGRPRQKTEPEKMINIGIPESLYKKMEVAKICHGNNMTQYIRKALERDIESNYEDYRKAAEALKKFE